MRFFFFIFVINIFLISCSNTNNINYADLNKRFNYNNYIEFTASIKRHFENNQMELNYSKLYLINQHHNQLLLRYENPYDNYIELTHKLIEMNVYENYIENKPNDIFLFIRAVIDTDYSSKDTNLQNKLSDNSQKIIFESMQAYLRYLTKDYTLK